MECVEGKEVLVTVVYSLRIGRFIPFLWPALLYCFYILSCLFLVCALDHQARLVWGFYKVMESLFWPPRITA